MTKSATKSHKQTPKPTSELVHLIAADAGVDMQTAKKVLNAFTNVVKQELSETGSVQVLGFGTWSIREVGEHLFMPIRGSEPRLLPAHKKVGFKVGSELASVAK